MEMRADGLMRAALDLWPDLAREMSEDPALWTAQILSRREDAARARILLRMTGPGGRALVLKHQLRPQEPEAFGAGLIAHMQAQEACPSAVPRLFAADAERQACVMEYLEAEPLAVLLDGAAPDAQAELLRRAGVWLEGYHRALPGEPRVFQPKHTIGYLRRVMAELRDGARKVFAPQRFLDCAERLCAAQDRYEGRRTVTAQTHGDLHLRNLMLDGQRCFGLDFAGGRVVPVGHDIARLLVDFAIQHADRAAIPAGEVLPPQMSAAFFGGYGLVGAEDPSVALLLRNRVLAEWWALPAREDLRSAAQARRAGLVASLAERVFG